MRKLTFISGPQRTGKSRLAAKLAEGKILLQTSTYSFSQNLSFVDEYDMIVIDDVNFLAKALKNHDLFEFLKKEKVLVRKPFTREKTEILIPDIIVITNCPIGVKDICQFGECTLIITDINQPSAIFNYTLKNPFL